ncbi:hypothetical protein LWX94_002736 [Enterococcus faecalis]|nr:hypothetical protein [Enterococcus faecalis]
MSDIPLSEVKTYGELAEWLNAHQIFVRWDTSFEADKLISEGELQSWMNFVETISGGDKSNE